MQAHGFVPPPTPPAKAMFVQAEDSASLKREMKKQRKQMPQAQASSFKIYLHCKDSSVCFKPQFEDLVLVEPVPSQYSKTRAEFKVMYARSAEIGSAHW
jgi:hypothetical protein